MKTIYHLQCFYKDKIVTIEHLEQPHVGLEIQYNEDTIVRITNVRRTVSIKNDDTETIYYTCILENVEPNLIGTCQIKLFSGYDEIEKNFNEWLRLNLSISKIKITFL